MSGTAQILASEVTLTGSYVAATNNSAVHGASLHTLVVIYTPKTNSTNALNLQIDVSHDGGTTWNQFGQYTNSTGTLSEEAATIAVTSSGTTAQNLVPYVFQIVATHIRIRAIETNTPANYGTYTATLRSTDS